MRNDGSQGDPFDLIQRALSFIKDQFSATVTSPEPPHTSAPSQFDPPSPPDDPPSEDTETDEVEAPTLELFTDGRNLVPVDLDSLVTSCPAGPDEPFRNDLLFDESDDGMLASLRDTYRQSFPVEKGPARRLVDAARAAAWHLSIADDAQVNVLGLRNAIISQAVTCIPRREHPVFLVAPETLVGLSDAALVFCFSRAAAHAYASRWFVGEHVTLERNATALWRMFRAGELYPDEAESNEELVTWYVRARRAFECTLDRIALCLGGDLEVAFEALNLDQPDLVRSAAETDWQRASSAIRELVEDSKSPPDRYAMLSLTQRGAALALFCHDALLGGRVPRLAIDGETRDILGLDPQPEATPATPRRAVAISSTVSNSPREVRVRPSSSQPSQTPAPTSPARPDSPFPDSITDHLLTVRCEEHSPHCAQVLLEFLTPPTDDDFLELAKAKGALSKGSAILSAHIESLDGTRRIALFRAMRRGPSRWLKALDGWLDHTVAPTRLSWALVTFLAVAAKRTTFDEVIRKAAIMGPVKARCAPTLATLMMTERLRPSFIEELRRAGPLGAIVGGYHEEVRNLDPRLC